MMAKKRVITFDTILEDLWTLREQIDQEVTEADAGVTSANADYDTAIARRDRIDEALSQLEDLI